MQRLTLLGFVLWIATAGVAAAPPDQPASGPGGSNYPHLLVKQTLDLDGWYQYRLYEPAWPTPATAPVLLYLPGIAGPGGYGGVLEFQLFASLYEPMLEHLARKGYTVILPAYGLVGAPLGNYRTNAIRATKEALAELDGPFHVSPEPRMFAIAGHSFGGLLALSIANEAEEIGLPIPLALICHEPALVSQMQQGCVANPGGPFCQLDLPAAFDGVNPETVNVTIVGGADRLGQMDATLAQWALPQIPAQFQNLLFVNDDANGNHALVAKHMSPGSHPFLDLPGLELNAIDWYGYWKPTEAALDFAFRGVHREFVLGDGDAVRFMGDWSNGTPVAPMSVASDFE